MSDKDFGGESPLPPVSRFATLTGSQATTTCRCQKVNKFTKHQVCANNLSVPATVQKIITEILPSSSGQSFARDARDLLIECCVEFITLISSEANDISEKEAKKTIAVEHIEKALTELGFQDYVPDVLAVADEFKDQQKVGHPLLHLGMSC